MPQGRVFNYSNHDLVVVHATNQGDRGNILHTEEVSPAGVEPKIIFHRDRKLCVIRGHKHGWRLVPGNQTYVYEREDPIFAPIENDIHFLRPDPHNLDPGYVKTRAQDIRSIPVNTSQWGENAPASGVRDGFNSIRWNNRFTSQEKLLAKYIRTGQDITIRLKLLQYQGMLPSELATLRTTIQGALDFWNSADPSHVCSTNPMRLRVDLVTEHEDATVQIRKRPAQGKRDVNTSKEWWNDARSDELTHEIGHLLGLMDEYYVYDRKAARNKNVTTRVQRRSAEKKDYPDRAKKREGNGACGTSRPKNVMEWHTAQSVLIDCSLLRTILSAQNVQRPCVR